MSLLPWKGGADQPQAEETTTQDREAVLGARDGGSSGSVALCLSWLFFFYGPLFPRDISLPSLTTWEWETVHRAHRLPSPAAAVKEQSAIFRLPDLPPVLPWAEPAPAAEADHSEQLPVLGPGREVLLEQGKAENGLRSGQSLLSPVQTSPWGAVLLRVGAVILRASKPGGGKGAEVKWTQPKRNAA